ncbi:MAG: DNA cytosine methyltransferase [Actinomycetota bacterium]|nr:DNA cytosine methyltransferase [Actinomycetota bacterium]
MSFGLDCVPGMAVVAAFERNAWACETHAANMAAPVVGCDVAGIRSFNTVLGGLGVRRVDVLAGGPPCQGFSKLGKGALRKMALSDGRRVDIEDERNWLFRHFIRAVRELSPQVVLMENVPELLRYGSIVEELRDVFKELGYTFDHRVLHAEKHGVPQRRRRLFMVANKHGLQVPWPDEKRRVRERTLHDAIGDLPEVPPMQLEEELTWIMPGRTAPYLKEMRRGMRGAAARIVRDHVTRFHGEKDVAAFRYMMEGDMYGSVPEELRRYRSDIFADKYHRMVWNRPAWTVTAHIAKDGYKYIHPEQHRTISVREAARIQSFPDRFRFAGSRTHRFTQIGNAVPPKLATALGTALLPLIR